MPTHSKVENIGFRSPRGGTAPLSTDAGGDSNMEPGGRYCACARVHGRRERQTIERERRRGSCTRENWQRQRTEQCSGKRESVDSVLRPVYDSPAVAPAAGSGQVSGRPEKMKLEDAEEALLVVFAVDSGVT